MGHLLLLLAGLAMVPSSAVRSDAEDIVAGAVRVDGKISSLAQGSHEVYQHLNVNSTAATTPSCQSFASTDDDWDATSQESAKSSSREDLDEIRGSLGILPSDGKFTPSMCTKRDVCLLMKQADFRAYAENKMTMQTRDPGQWWYYSTYKLKESMRRGGTITGSASCSFGALADLYTQGWTASACAQLMSYRGSDAALQEYRKIFMQKMSNEWCPQVWEEAIQKGEVCTVTRRGRKKYALDTDACDEITDEKLTKFALAGEAGREAKWYGVGGQEIS
jgi:hypothetical protein